MRKTIISRLHQGSGLRTSHDGFNSWAIDLITGMAFPVEGVNAVDLPADGIGRNQTSRGGRRPAMSSALRPAKLQSIHGGRGLALEAGHGLPPCIMPTDGSLFRQDVPAVPFVVLKETSS